MIILLTGKSGQLGTELHSSLSSLGEVVAIDREDVDLCDASATRRSVHGIAPDLIVNAAGYTAVDRAESDIAACRALNSSACAVLAELAHQIGCPLVHYSTDYVFSGDSHRPYAPDDPANPVNEYGRSKLEGERAIRTSRCRHLILRTSWLYGLHGQNFLQTMLELARTQKLIKVVNDQIGCPTWSRTVAETTSDILHFMFDQVDSQEAFRRFGGTYHLTSLGETSWYDFAKSIFQIADLPEIPVLLPVTTDQFPRPARRPSYSVLDCSRTTSTFGISLPHWQDALREVLVSRRSLGSPIHHQSAGDTR